MRTIVSFIILVLVVFVTLPFKSNAATNFKPENQLLRPDIVFGKDREILHASIDLKWLFGMVLDKKTWITLCAYAVEKMKRVNSDHNNKVTYREEATNELLGLRSYNEKTPLRLTKPSYLFHHTFVLYCCFVRFVILKGLSQFSTSGTLAVSRKEALRRILY